MQPRVFLFYGSDSFSSLKAVHEWERLFLAKHGDIGRYVIEADELSEKELTATLAGYIQGQTLFSTPKLVLIKRISSQAKSVVKAVARTLETYVTGLDNAVTVVFWEERGLRASHPLQALFTDLEARGLAKVKLFSVPSERKVSSRVEKIVRERGGAIDPEAVAWVNRAYSLLGKQSRLALRLKSTEALLEDERGWWLHTLLENALLAAVGKEISVSLLESIYQLEAAVGVFEVVTALSNRRFDQARQLLKAAKGDDGFYFSLLAALRWQARKVHDDALQRLVVEMELILKNFTVQPVWIVDVLLARLEQESEAMIIPARRLWLFHLLRS